MRERLAENQPSRSLIAVECVISPPFGFRDAVRQSKPEILLQSRRFRCDWNFH
jgi:hypothetical protein